MNRTPRTSSARADVRLSDRGIEPSSAFPLHDGVTRDARARAGSTRAHGPAEHIGEASTRARGRHGTDAPGLDRSMEGVEARALVAQ